MSPVSSGLKVHFNLFVCIFLLCFYNFFKVAAVLMTGLQDAKGRGKVKKHALVVYGGASPSHWTPFTNS